MERRSLAQDVRRWATEEMGLSAHRAPTEEILQRLFIGQCGDIWKYIIRHVFSQGTVKKVEGNLMWYQQLKRSETQRTVEEEQRQRRKQLCRQILDLRLELQHLQEQIRCSEQEIAGGNLNVARSQDFCRRVLLLEAFRKKKDEECKEMFTRFELLKVRANHLKTIHNLSLRPIPYSTTHTGPLTFAYPEPVELTSVRDICRGRFSFLQSLYDEALLPVAVNNQAVHVQMHRQWVSDVQRAWFIQAPNHVLAALKHIALESTDDMKHLQRSLVRCRNLLFSFTQKPRGGVEDDDSDSHEDDNYDEDEVDDDEEEEEEECDEDGDDEDSNASDDTPIERAHRQTRAAGLLPTSAVSIDTFQCLLMEGWEDSIKVTSSLHFIQSRIEQYSERISTVIQETKKKLSDRGDLAALTRTAFDTELRAVVTRAYRDGLALQCQQLQQAVNDKREEAKVLQQKKEMTEVYSKLLVKKQSQLHILLKEGVTAKERIKKLHEEVRLLMQNKLQPLPQQIFRETERLRDAINKEVMNFSAIYLPSLQKVSIDGTSRIPKHELSINRLSDIHNPYYSIYRGLFGCLEFSAFKAPECLLRTVADLKNNMFFMQAQLTSHKQAIKNLQLLSQNHKNPDTEVLLKMLADHYAQQTDCLVPKLQFLIQQCQKSQEYGKDVQAAITDWWEQPAQQCLPEEQRGGLTLQQWRDRWTVAAAALQRVSGGPRLRATNERLLAWNNAAPPSV